MDGAHSYDDWKLRSDRDEHPHDEGLMVPRLWRGPWMTECVVCGQWPALPGEETCTECVAARALERLTAEVDEAIAEAEQWQTRR